MVQDKWIHLNEQRAVTLHAMLQETGGEFMALTARPAVLILPGGGYAMCSDREAEPVAYPFLAAGYDAFVLRYSIRQFRTWPNPLEDYEAAMEMIAQHAKEWHVMPDRIAVIGFSAGGHLAACAATMAKHRPAAAVLGYAALDQEICGALSHENPLPVPVEHVDQDTCPCFLFAARDDRNVPPLDTLHFAERLMAYDISFEMHLYAFGGHGFGTGAAADRTENACTRLPRWTEDAISWLSEQMGTISTAGLGEPVLGRHADGDRDPMLSVFCTIAHLRSQKGEAKELLREPMAYLTKAAAAAIGREDALEMFLSRMTLAQLLSMTGVSKDRIEALNAKLKTIPNKVEETA